MGDIKKTNVVGGEERNLDAKVTETAEQSGRPVNDTQERADAAKVPEVGALVDDKGKKVSEDKAEEVKVEEYANDDKTKTHDDTARNDITPPQDKKVVDEKEVEEPVKEQTIDSDKQTVNDTKQDRSPAVALPADPTKEETSVRDESSTPTNTSEDEQKSNTPDDLVKSVQALLTKLNDSEQGNSDLKKMADNLQKSVDKVAKSISSLEDRVKTIEDTPLPTKGQRYHVVAKGDDSEEDVDVKAIQKRQEEIMENPSSAKPGEAEEIVKALRKAKVGEKITIK